MNKLALALTLLAPATLAAPAAAQQSETREGYLARLREICAVECLEPRPFQRAARKQPGEGDAARSEDMAVIMDVADVRRNGDRFELFNLDVSTSDLETIQLLASASVNTSSSTGVGGLPRGRGPELHPEVIVVSLDAQAFSDILNPVAPLAAQDAVADASGAASQIEARIGPDGRIIVDASRREDAEEARREPNLTNLRTYFRNRRIVARGTPELTAQWVGGRIDRRNKQVTLMVDNADDLVLLPRYDEDGEAILEGPLAGLAQRSGGE